jgi:hypothetical protein
MPELNSIEKVRIENHNGKRILIVDYSNGNESAMIEAVDRAKLLLQSENRPTLVLSIFNNKNYLTTNYIRHLKKELKEVEHLIHKNTVIGLSQIQTWILKGVNLWTEKQITDFDSFEKAIDFLLKD